MREQSPNRRRSWLDRLLFAGFVLGAGVLVFTAGVVVAAFKLPPYPWFRDAGRAAEAVWQWTALRSESTPDAVWKQARHQGKAGNKGLLQYKADQAFDGYTLYSTGAGCDVTLLDMRGERVHRWELSAAEVWPDPDHIMLSPGKGQIYTRRAHVYPNGDLLACFVSTATTPYGYGLARFDKAGKLIWKYDAHFHHDFHVAEDGTIYALTQEVRRQPPDALPELRNDVLDDFIVTLTPDGKLKQRVSVLDAMLNSEYSDALTRRLTHDKDRWDLLHTNSVHRIGPDFAAAHEGVEAGQVLVMIRNLNLLAAIDLEAGAVTWGMAGPWHRPHDPQPLANGHITIFDNQVLHNHMRGSRVIELDPGDSQIVWSYRGGADEPFYSPAHSRQQVLPNGNVLIVEAHGGRIFEVTRGGEIVWSFVTPTRGGEKDRLVPIITDAVRYRREALPFVTEGRGGTGGEANDSPDGTAGR
jgi:outer membrane protein assembly factor BamB